jgi:hypothetical protein
VTEVVARALRHAGLDPRPEAGWRRRLAWSALLPRISGRFSHLSGNAELLDLHASSGGNRLDLSGYLALRWEVRASWDLSRLLFDSRELGISARASQLANERAALAERVVQLYFERLRLLRINKDKVSAPAALDVQLELARTTALLDALTGGLYAARSGSRAASAKGDRGAR